MVDTNKNNFLVNNEKDLESLYQMYKIRNNLMNYIPMEEFIERSRTIIDECEDFSFRSNNARKFIDPKRPEFILRLDNHDKVYKPEGRSEQELDTYSESVGKLASEQILTYISRQLREYLDENEDFKKVLEDNDETIVNLSLTNMYSIKVADPEANIINIKLIA